ncbi:dysbindin isoform X1 [Salmo trutta]|uniref:dysbindin isoform X1 n=1 Tax=Salmo trutta TaxID=8032 RepID=UPI0011311C9B|nr:dysbindin-like isoform X1 [Salmo trutta]
MSSSPGSMDGSQRNSSEKVPPQVKEAEPAQEKPKEMEPGQFKLKEAELAQMKMKERQKFFEEAFQQDIDQYLSTGYLQISERRGERPTLTLTPCHLQWRRSFSSMEVNVDMLEQMDLSDHESLDVFLLSGGDDNNAASPMLGPDVDSLTTEITLQVPTQAELGNKLSSLSSTCTDSQDTEAGDDDEEDEGGRENSSHSPVGVQRSPPTLS